MYSFGIVKQALRQDAPEPKHHKVLTALERLQKFDRGGLEISCSREDRTGLDSADQSISAALASPNAAQSALRP